VDEGVRYVVDDVSGFCLTLSMHQGTLQLNYTTTEKQWSRPLIVISFFHNQLLLFVFSKSTQS
jgi:hypothetical protein